MVGGMFINHIFSPFSICTSAGSLFLVSLCPSIYGAAFERMFTRNLINSIKDIVVFLGLKVLNSDNFSAFSFRKIAQNTFVEKPQLKVIGF